MIGKILTRLFALFGMSLTCVACYGTPYDEYHPDYIATGRVVDPDGNTIENIRVVMDSSDRTDENGVFELKGTSRTLTFIDDDGEANGGEFEMLDIRIENNYENVNLGDVELKRKER